MGATQDLFISVLQLFTLAAFFFLLTLKGMSMARTTELKDLWGEVRREMKLRVLQRTMMELKSQENLIAGGQMKRDC